MALVAIKSPCLLLHSCSDCFGIASRAQRRGLAPLSRSLLRAVSSQVSADVLCQVDFRPKEGETRDDAHEPARVRPR